MFATMHGDTYKNNDTCPIMPGLEAASLQQIANWGKPDTYFNQCKGLTPQDLAAPRQIKHMLWHTCLWHALHSSHENRTP